MRRALRMVPITARTATGMSFGPINTSATATMTPISDQEKLNMPAGC